MFEREHHRRIALVLQALDPQVLAALGCHFGGGTAMALRYGEYRESVDIDFLVSDLAGYRELRQRLAAAGGLQPLVRAGMQLELARELRADQYGVRTLLRGAGAPIKFEIVLEGRITLDPPGPQDQVCGVPTLTPVDLAAEKLLANADRWADDAVFSRDLIDLAMQNGHPDLLRAACAKAEGAYGAAIRQALATAVQALGQRPRRLDECLRALGVTGASKAQVWQRLRRLARQLPVVATPATGSSG